MSPTGGAYKTIPSSRCMTCNVSRLSAVTSFTLFGGESPPNKRCKTEKITREWNVVITSKSITLGLIDKSWMMDNNLGK